jgi:hypothetical protein
MTSKKPSGSLDLDRPVAYPAFNYDIFDSVNEQRHNSLAWRVVKSSNERVGDYLFTMKVAWLTVLMTHFIQTSLNGFGNSFITCPTITSSLKTGKIDYNLEDAPIYSRTKTYVFFLTFDSEYVALYFIDAGKIEIFFPFPSLLTPEVKTAMCNCLGLINDKFMRNEPLLGCTLVNSSFVYMYDFPSNFRESNVYLQFYLVFRLQQMEKSKLNKYIMTKDNIQEEAIRVTHILGRLMTRCFLMTKTNSSEEVRKKTEYLYSKFISHNAAEPFVLNPGIANFIVDDVFPGCQLTSDDYQSLLIDPLRLGVKKESDWQPKDYDSPQWSRYAEIPNAIEPVFYFNNLPWATDVKKGSKKDDGEEDGDGEGKKTKRKTKINYGKTHFEEYFGDMEPVQKTKKPTQKTKAQKKPTQKTKAQAQPKTPKAKAKTPRF